MNCQLLHGCWVDIGNINTHVRTEATGLVKGIGTDDAVGKSIRACRDAFELCA